MSVLVVTPHPDDAEYGCGGLIAGLVAVGIPVVVVGFTPSGELPGEGGAPADAAVRMAEGDRAAVTLGVTCRWLPARHIGESLAGTGDLVAVLRTVRPDVVITVDEDDSHPFHRAVAQWTVQAVFCSALASVDIEDSQPLPWPPQLLFMEAFTSRRFLPDHLVNVTPWFALARRALLQHETGTAITPGLEHQMRSTHMLHGCAAAVPFAEGFKFASGYAQRWARARTRTLEMLVAVDRAACGTPLVESRRSG